MERYCSSYYDRHGLYNDGFPCPGQTYCCEKDDGHKMCCSEASLVQDSQQDNQIQSAASSTIIQQIMNTKSPNNFNNHNFNFGQNQQQHGQIGAFNPGQHQSTVAVSSISFLMSNSALILSVCLAFGVLVILTSLLLACVYRLCTKASSNSSKKRQGADEKALNHHMHHNHHGSYSRNSSSSSSSGSSSSCNGTSITSTSPKGNEIMHCEDEEDLDECRNILTIDPNIHHMNTHRPQMLASHQTGNGSLMLSTNRSSHESYLLLQQQNNRNSANTTTSSANLNQHPIYSNLPGHYNAISSGSSSVCTSLLLNNLNQLNSANTTQSLVFNSNNISNENNTDNKPANLNLISDLVDNGDNTDDEMEPHDFITSTSSNLEFLKQHSLFNSTPMNYYPTLGLTMNKQAIPTTVTESKQQQQPIYSDPKKLLLSGSGSSTSSGGRFSTFLPTLSGQSTTGTTTAIYDNKTNNDLI